MSPATAPTRRARKYAAQDSDWKVASACRGTDPEAFFAVKKAEQKTARRVCAGCPVIAECLVENRRFDDTTYRSGIFGGLTELQRRALEVEERLGNVPNLRMARRLMSKQFKYLLRRAQSNQRTLTGIGQELREMGLMVDDVTVRVALWWLGFGGARVVMPRPRPGLVMPVWLRVEHGAWLVRLRGEGLTLVEVAAYLGAPLYTVAQAIAGIEKAAQDGQVSA